MTSEKTARQLRLDAITGKSKTMKQIAAAAAEPGFKPPAAHTDPDRMLPVKVKQEHITKLHESAYTKPKTSWAKSAVKGLGRLASALTGGHGGR